MKRIEHITEEILKGIKDIKHLYMIRTKILNLYNTYFEGNNIERVKYINLSRHTLLHKYVLLKMELKNRGKEYYSHKSILDSEVKEAYENACEEERKRNFKKSLWELDVPTLGDAVIVPEYISIAGSFIRSPKEADDVDVVIREDENNRDESLELKVGRLIRDHTKKDPHFIYSPKGPHSSYIPLFDLILRSRDETKKVNVKESVVAKDLTVAQQKECDKETVQIKENRKKAKFPHNFKAAKFTHPNGHPRCIICGQEEREGGICKLELRRSREVSSERAYYEGLDDWDANLRADNAEVMKRLAKGSVLDLGCGTCKLLKLLKDKGREVKGVDRSDTAREFCEARDIGFIKVDLEKDDLPLEDGSFDNVICVHTLEHLELPEKLIKDACRIAKRKVVILSPLGKRLDPSHKQKFLTVNNFKQYFGRQWEVKEIEESNSAIAAREFKEIGKAALVPFGRFTPPKPTMSGLTEAFSVEQIWNWSKDKFPLDVEEKLNGFRFIIEKAADRVRLKTDGGKDRTKQLPMITDALKKIPDDFIADCSMGIERAGKALPRVRLMTLMADKPELEEGDVVKATLFDLPYWKEDLHERPLEERRKSLEAFYDNYLKASPCFGLTSYNVVKDRAGLEAQFKRLSKFPQSEGILIKTLDGKWDTDGSAETWAKLKREAEIKAIVLERHEVKGGNYNYTYGLDIGQTDYEANWELDKAGNPIKIKKIEE